MKRLFAFFSLVLVSGTIAFGAADKKGPSLSPVETVRAFFNAMADSDEAKIKAIALPNPKLKTLWAKKPSEQEIDVLNKAAKDDLRVLRPGETVPMGDGVMTVPPPTNNLVFVYGPLMSFPFPVSRVDGTWKVNASPLLAANGPVAAPKKK